MSGNAVQDLNSQHGRTRHLRDAVDHPRDGGLAPVAGRPPRMLDRGHARRHVRRVAIVRRSATWDAIEYEHIRQLLGRYNIAIDLGDPEGWAATFTPDCVFHCTGLPEGNPLGGRYEGTDQLIDYAKLHYRIAKGRARHWNANLVNDSDGETARCAVTCWRSPPAEASCRAPPGSTRTASGRLTASGACRAPHCN